ncbi:hypothetical protein P0082_01265 [Candidatus Haliotispira prima]|uniref:Uncharacterized protein n=1 Tax=Candidatus Haliotispira prima TaxID=3034016 RepID=A0ABY8ML35_9SPIO|nr:hypothetical protein P0082_01265 [Candidatus Haliotispira prima]
MYQVISANPGYSLLLLGGSLFLLRQTLRYAFSVRIILGKKRFRWRSNRDFRLRHCLYSDILRLSAGEAFEPGQSIYDFSLLRRHKEPGTLSLDFIGSKRLIRALIQRGVVVTPQLLHYFLYSQNQESQLIERNWRKSEKRRLFGKWPKRVSDRKWQQLRKQKLRLRRRVFGKDEKDNKDKYLGEEGRTAESSGQVNKLYYSSELDEYG